MTTATKVKHTLGPWSIGERKTFKTATGYDNQEVTIDGRHTTTLASVWGDDEDTEFNAKLIAAAPELLEALIDLLYHVEDIPGNEYFDEKIFSNARKAINKATS